MRLAHFSSGGLYPFNDAYIYRFLLSWVVTQQGTPNSQRVNETMSICAMNLESNYQLWYCWRDDCPKTYS